jgi:hypothetical protein
MSRIVMDIIRYDVLHICYCRRKEWMLLFSAFVSAKLCILTYFPLFVVFGYKSNATDESEAICVRDCSVRFTEPGV